MSLLGSVAYTSHTRPDVSTFITALQRKCKKPQIIHCKRLNALVKWLQTNPTALIYKYLTNSGNFHLRIYSDAAFKKEETTGHSTRGAVYALCPTKDEFTTTTKVCLIDFITKQQRRVTRSTFVAELLAACDAVDRGIILSQMLHEICTGNNSVSIARQLRENGGYAIPMALYVDAQSVFVAITSAYIKIPADNGVLSHIQYIRELLDTRVLLKIFWVDTRDMCADGLTKGSISRDAIQDIMEGKLNLLKGTKGWTPPKQLSQPDSIQ